MTFYSLYVKTPPHIYNLTTFKSDFHINFLENGAYNNAQYNLKI